MPIRRIGGRNRQRPSRKGKKSNRTMIIAWAKRQKILPVCSACGKIRYTDPKGKEMWVDIGFKNPGKSRPDFPNLSHGICPEDVMRLYPELYNKDKPQGK